MTHFDSVPIILEVFWHSSVRAGRHARHVCVRGSMAALAAMDNCRSLRRAASITRPGVDQRRAGEQSLNPSGRDDGVVGGPVTETATARGSGAVLSDPVIGKPDFC